MFSEHAIKTALNHKCLNCHYIRMNKNFKNCYCEITQARIQFARKVEIFCPLLAIICRELSAPHISFNNKSAHVMLEDGLICLIEENNGIYDIDINEYRYTGYKFNAHQGCKSYSGIKAFKHSEIKRFISDEEINELIKIK